jgi:hypothetical protein
MKPDASKAAMVSLSDLSSQEHNFEAVFQVPSSHHIVAVRSRTQGGMTTTVVWKHDKYDASGQLVARYKSYEHVNAAGERRCRWEKLDAQGKPVTGSQLSDGTKSGDDS